MAGSCGTHRIPKFLPFDWLTQPRPQKDPGRRWRDVVRKDLKEVKICEKEWYDEAMKSRAGRRVRCRLGI